MIPITVTMTSQQQGHALMAAKVWPQVKAILMAGRNVVVTVQEQEDQRSLQQLRFYWGCVLKHTSEQAKINGTGATADGWNLYFKREHLGYKFTKHKLPGKTRPSIIKELRSTSGLSVKKMSVYLEKCIAQAVTNFGVMFPVRRWEDYRVDPETGEIMMDNLSISGKTADTVAQSELD